MGLLLLAPFVVIVTGIVVIGLASLQQSHSSGFVGWLEQTLGRAAAFVIPTAQAIIDLTRWIARKLGDHFEGIERLTVGWIGGLYQYVERVGAMTLLWPLELFKVTYWLIWHEIPRMIAALPTAVGKVTHWVEKRVVRIERTVVKLPKLSAKLAENIITAALPGLLLANPAIRRFIARLLRAVAIPLIEALPIPHGLTWKGIKARMRRLEKLNWASAAFAGAVAIALTRIGAGWLRCGSVRRLGKRIGCGGFGLLESFFADAFEVFIVTNLCTFIYLMQKAAEQMRPELLAFVKLENALIGCHGNKKPPYLAHTTAEPPPVIDALTLAA